MSALWMIAEAPALFELPSPPAPSTAAFPCMWHPEPDQEATHRVVIAVDLMNPRWWQSGGLRPDGGLRACDGGRVRLHVVGAGHCDACVASNAGAGFRRGMVEHFIPLDGRR